MSNKELDAAWAAAQANPGQAIDIGRTVVCDYCNDDYTDSNEHGGFIFGSYGTCPKCALRMLPMIEAEGETRYIRARCPEALSFADFVRAYRGGNNTITIHTPPRGGQS